MVNKKSKIGFITVAAVATSILGSVWAAAAILSSVSPAHAQSGSQSATLPKASRTTGCKEKGGLPDAACTPGALNPNVTQGTIKQTICVSGYTNRIRPATTYTNNLKTRQIAAYRYADTKPSDYEEDHLVSLELGGSPTDPANLWPEPYKEAYGSK